MLRVTLSSSVEGAKTYYTHSLKQEGLGNRQASYYAQEQEIIGQWGGHGAERLGLMGRVDQDSFEALCENRIPGGDERLTLSNKENRRVGYDFSFHCPKSVSVVQAITGDENIVSSFRESVSETMREIESEMKTRVRVGGQNEDRITGNMVWGEFVHFTARPVEGCPDPHLHAHCFAFNATHDANENGWKAGQFGDIKRDASYYEAAFHARFAHRLTTLGYAVERTDNGWELSGISRSVIEKFSQRTEAIEKVAAELGIQSNVAKDKLGARTRERKAPHLSREELKHEWASRLSDEEREAIESISVDQSQSEQYSASLSARQAMDYALEHTFETHSAVPEKHLWKEALRFGVGNVDVNEIQRQSLRREILSDDVNGERVCTTHTVREEEQANVRFVRAGLGICDRLNPMGYELKNDRLTREQRDAVLHVIGSKDRVIGIRGAAGTGKTTMMKEAVAAIESGGHRVHTSAPSADASRGVLRQEGFENAQTVQHLLLNERLQDQLRGQVIWIDEAGLLGARQMRKIFAVAEKQQCRVILSGDARQHHAVERGDAFRSLQEHAGLPVAELTGIRRQSIQEYREAVTALSTGDVETGFMKLDALGAIREVAMEDRHQRLAADYVEAVSTRKSALVVSPTHAEGGKATRAIRENLKSCGMISQDEHTIRRLKNLHWSQAQKKDHRHYRPGHVIQFHQNVHGFARGEKVTVAGIHENGNVAVAKHDGTLIDLPLHHGNRFSIHEAQAIALASGDVIRITQNGSTVDGKHRLNNGAIYKVKAVSLNGQIELTNGWKLASDFGHVTHGYCVTSHSSQGKTVDRVFIAQSAESSRAASREQFYVSVSRGREAVTIYTDNKEDLKQAVFKSDVRISALDLKESNVSGQTQTFKSRAHALKTQQLSRQQRKAVKLSEASKISIRPQPSQRISL